MIKDYSVYELSDKEKILFYLVGYICIFSASYLFYHSLIISAIAGVAVHFAVLYQKIFSCKKDGYAEDAVQRYALFAFGFRSGGKADGGGYS